MLALQKYLFFHYVTEFFFENILCMKKMESVRWQFGVSRMLEGVLWAVMGKALKKMNQ